MSRTFTTATDENLLELIQAAKHRLIVIAPAVTTAVAKILVARMADLSTLSLDIILDADSEVYRLGYGDIEALTAIREASCRHMVELREQPGIRIGVVVSDHRTLVYSPVPRNVEAGSKTEEKPNALLLEDRTAEALAQATAVAGPQAEVGQFGLDPDQIETMVKDLEANPPQPFDLSRKLRVFRSEVQFVELKMKNTKLRSRRVQLPKELQKLNDHDLRSRINSSLKTPIDLETGIAVTVESNDGKKKINVNEKYFEREREALEAAFFREWKGRGKIILRREKDQAEEQLKRLKQRIKSYHEALQKKVEENKRAFRSQLVTEFLEQWMFEPPVRLRMRGETDYDSCRTELERQADELFDKAVVLGEADYEVVYKDIAIEDLEDPNRMQELRQLMHRTGIDADTLNRLFEIGDAAAAKSPKTSVIPN